MYVSLCWLTNTGMFMCRSSSENIAFEFVFTSSSETSMSFLPYLDGLCDGEQLLLFCGVMFPEKEKLKT